MFRIRAVATLIFLIVGFTSLKAFSHNQRHEDDYIYDQLITIRGRVGVFNRAEQQVVAASGAYLIFQRVGCNQCLVATTTDIEGNYSIRVGRGRYRIVYRDILSDPSRDVLAPDQPRYVDVTSEAQEKQFNINLTIPPTR
jgi:hypothetical protein